MAKAATNLTTAVSDITAYYTAKGSFKTSPNATSNISDFSLMTNALTKDGKLNVKGSTTCVTVQLPQTTNNGSDAVKITLQFTGTDAVCQTLKTLPGIKSMCGQSGSGDSITSSNCKIQVGGSGGINF